MEQEQITLPKGAWAAIVQVVARAQMPAEHGAEVMAVLRSAKVDPVHADAPDK